MRYAGIILHQNSCSSRNHVSRSWGPGLGFGLLRFCVSDMGTLLQRVPHLRLKKSAASLCSIKGCEYLTA